MFKLVEALHGWTGPALSCNSTPPQASKHLRPNPLVARNLYFSVYGSHGFSRCLLGRNFLDVVVCNVFNSIEAIPLVELGLQLTGEVFIILYLFFHVFDETIALFDFKFVHSDLI